MRRLLPDPIADVSLGDGFAVEPGEDLLRTQLIASVDGAASAAGVSAGLSNETDRRLLQTLRELADAVLVGAGTVRAEKYGGVRLDEDVRRSRLDAGRPGVPPIVVVSRRAEFEPTDRIFVDTAVTPILVTTDGGAERARRDLGVLAEVIAAGRDEIDLRAAVGELRERGLSQLHCEGGPKLFGELLEADLVDELCLTIAPLLAGGDAARITATTASFDPPRPVRLAHLFADDEGFLFARYRLH